MPLAPAGSNPGALKTKIIFNPAANKGGCGKNWPAIKARLEAVLGAIDATPTVRRGDGTGIARAAFAQGHRRFIAVGGDGTLNEVVNGLVAGGRLLEPGIVFAQIPAGTSNAVSLALGHAGRGAASDGAFAALAGTATQPIDLFRVDSFGADGKPIARFGFLLVTLGAPATVGLRAAAIPLLKRLGPVAYVIVAAVTALTYKPRAVQISIDDGAPRKASLWGAMLCSSPTAGEGLLLAPGAKIDDGQIDLLEIGALTRREALLQIIPKLADGSYSLHPKVTRQLLKQIHIATQEPIPVDVDGEPSGESPLRVRVLPEPMRVAVADSG